MAKVTGPLMSLDASGTVANTTTFSKWKGRNYVRLRVIPQNPQSVAQQAVRSALGTFAKAARAVLTIFNDAAVPAVGSPFYTAAVGVAPSNQSWVSYMQKLLYADFTAIGVEWAAVSGTNQAFYETEAGVQGLAAYTDMSGDSHTAGELLFTLAYYAETVLDIAVAGGRGTPTNEAAVQAFGAAVGETTP